MASSFTIQSISQGAQSTQAGPLQSLYTTKSLGTILNYPSDLGSATKNHYVKFWIKQINTTAIHQKTGVLINNILSDPFGSLSNMSIQPPTQDSLAVICLYMPDTVNASYHAEFDKLSLTNDLGKGLKAIQTVGSIVDSILAKNPSSIYGSEAEVAALSAMLDATGNSNIAAAALSSLGYAVNPQIQTIFRGVGFREFSLSFNFTPSSKSEAQTVNDIISTFKYHYAPDVLSASGTNNGLFFVPPSFFDIEFMFGENENKYLPRYADCVLTGIDVNYAPNGFSAHIDGAPTQTQLTMNFQEIEIVTKKKLQNGASAGSSGAPYSSASGLR